MCRFGIKVHTFLFSFTHMNLYPISMFGSYFTGQGISNNIVIIRYLSHYTAI